MSITDLTLDLTVGLSAGRLRLRIDAATLTDTDRQLVAHVLGLLPLAEQGPAPALVELEPVDPEPLAVSGEKTLAKPATCDLCPATFGTTQGLLVHRARMHKSAPRTPVPRSKGTPKHQPLDLSRGVAGRSNTPPPSADVHRLGPLEPGGPIGRTDDGSPEAIQRRRDTAAESVGYAAVGRKEERAEMRQRAEELAAKPAAAERRCDFPGCGTILSRFNKGERCAPHERAIVLAAES